MSRRPFHRFLAAAILLFACLAPASPQAASPATPAAEARGLAIAREADRRDRGFGDYAAVMTMILTNRHGETSKREMRLFVLEMPDDGDRSLLIFDSPADVRGTALLTWAHRERDDDQWLYLPALKRVKRISGRNRSGAFMGSEFSYEDIASQEVTKYRYRFLGEEKLNGRTCLVNERRPAQGVHSGYQRQVVWLDSEMYQPWKIDYYDRKGALLKTLTFEGYQRFLATYWRPTAMHMQNHQTGKRTDLLFRRYRFATGLTPADLSRNRLGRRP